LLLLLLVVVLLTYTLLECKPIGGGVLLQACVNRRFRSNRHHRRDALAGRIVQIDLDVTEESDTFEQLFHHLEANVDDLDG